MADRLRELAVSHDWTLSAEVGRALREDVQRETTVPDELDGRKRSSRTQKLQPQTGGQGPLENVEDDWTPRQSVASFFRLARFWRPKKGIWREA
jgi:hypothetical protein